MIAWLLASAFAGSLDGEFAVDTLYAGSTSDQPGSGPEASQSAAELGLRVRGEVLEADDRLVIGLDYRGREPVAGAFQNGALRLLYRGDIAWRADDVEVALGRFVAPAVVWLPMDGVRGTFEAGDTWITAYGGRRGISASRRPLPLSAFLPAAGAQLGRATEDYRAELLGTFSGDRVFLGPPDAEVTEDISGGSGMVRTSITAVEGVSFGGQVSAARNATYGVSDVAGQFDVSVEALSLYDGFGWVSFRPSRGVRVDVDALHQRAELARDAAPVEVALVDPSFSDVRLRGAFGMPDHGWVRPDVRLRLREGRTELRYGGGIDAHDLGVTGPFVRGNLWLEDIMEEGPDDVGAIDRILWRAGAGYERGPIQLEAGASFVDVAAGPVSGRVSNPANPGAPLSSEDLAPFTLQAQNTGFLRGFVATRRLFAGLDVEANVEDGEVRAFLQVGVLGDATW